VCVYCLYNERTHRMRYGHTLAEMPEGGDVGVHTKHARTCTGPNAWPSHRPRSRVAAAHSNAEDTPRLERKSSPKYYRILEDTSQLACGPYPGRNGVAHRIDGIIWRSSRRSGANSLLAPTSTHQRWRNMQLCRVACRVGTQLPRTRVHMQGSHTSTHVRMPIAAVT
jgi:hypothetical protein